MKTSIFVLACVTASGACAAEPDDGAEPFSSSRAELSDTPSLPADALRVASRPGPISEKELNRLFTIEHRIRVGAGRWIHATESLSIRSILRWPHRAVLMLPGPLTKGDFYNVDVDGYRFRDMLAERGFFSISIDFEGTGVSDYPADGRTAIHDAEVEAVRRVVEYFRIARLVLKVDLLGESWGGGVAAELCADSKAVGSCTMLSMLYKTPSDFANMTFRSPTFRGALDTIPDGYYTTTAEIYRTSITNASPAAVQDWTASHEPGRYTIVPLLDVFDLPFFDPTIARVPGLVVQGELDPNQSLDDTRQLAADYDSTGAKLVIIPNAGHVPRVEAPPSNALVSDAVMNFLELRDR